MLKQLVKKQFVKKHGKSKGGFTLIELIVVIAILGILAAILIPVVGGFIGSARTNSANADAHTVFTAAQTYIANGGTPDAAGTAWTASQTNVNVYAASSGNALTLTDLKSYLGSQTLNFTINQINVSVDSSGNASVTGVKITETAGNIVGKSGYTS